MPKDERYLASLGEIYRCMDEYYSEVIRFDLKVS